MKGIHKRCVVEDRQGEIVKKLDTWVTNCSPNPDCDVFFNLICDGCVGQAIISCIFNELDVG